MTVSELHVDDGSQPADGPLATTTFMVSDHVVTTANLLSCDQGEFHTVTLASLDSDARIVLAGTRPDLARTFRAALVALDDGTQDSTPATG